MSHALRQRVAQRVQDLRRVHNWSKTRLADKSGIHRNTIHSIERAQRSLGLDHLERLAQVFGVPASALVEEQNAELE